MNHFVVWLYTSSPTFFVTATLVTFVVIGVGGQLLAHRWIRKWLPTSNEVAVCMISCASLIYALILGLIAVATLESFNKVDDTAGQEAFSVGNLYRDLAGYPQPQRDSLRAKLGLYLHHVIEVEWPIQQCGKPLEQETPLVDQLVTQWEAVEPHSEGQNRLHAQALMQLNQFLALRRNRVQANSVGLPPIMWLTVLLGGALNIVLTYFFSIEKLYVHVLLVGAYSAMIALVVATIISQDKPLLGSTSVSSDAYERILTDVMHEPPIQHPPLQCR